MVIFSPQMRQTKSLLLMSLILYSMSSLWTISSWAVDTVKNDLVDTSEKATSGALDGMVFIGGHGPSGKPADIEDTFVFKDGNFISKEGEAMCQSPACPYFIRHVGNTIEFISETRCQDKNAKIFWRGTVDGETIKGVFHWTNERWYWTIEKDFWFEGTLVENTATTLGSQ